MSTKSQSSVKEWIRAFILAICIALFVRFFLFEIFIVDGLSMYPTLNDGERIFVNKMAYWFKQPQQGDVVVLKLPHEEDKDLVKRIIATGGDTVLIEGGKVFVNEVALTEDYLNEGTEGHYGPVTIPANCVFVMGDNRNYSLDSRNQLVGFIDSDLIRGQAIAVIWPFTSWSILK